MNKESDELSKRIKKIRSELGLTLEEFGDLVLGANKSLASKWERGTTPNNERLKKIAELGGISVTELLHGSNAELKAKVTQYTDEIMKTEIKEMNSQKYKELYDPILKKETIEVLLNRYNFEGLSDIGIKQYTKKILDEHLDKIIYERKYKPHCNKSAINFISARLDDLLKQHVNSYFRDDNITKNYSHYLEIDELKANLSYDLYTDISNIIIKARDEINNLEANYNNEE